jgi:hypothetical protein
LNCWNPLVKRSMASWGCRTSNNKKIVGQFAMHARKD